MMKSINSVIYSCLYIIAYLISLLPMWILYIISDVLYIFLFYFIGYRKTIVIQNLSRSFPDKNYKEIENVMKSFYHSFCDNIIEILKTISISRTKQASKIKVLNFDIIENQIAQGKTVIASMGHCGNWEILNILSNILNINSYAVYKPLKIKPIDKLFLKLRSRFGMQLITAKSVARHFLSNKNNPSVYFFLADQCPKIIDKKYQFGFLHQITSVFSGIEKLSRSTNSAVVYIHVNKISRGMYQIECKDISADLGSNENINITHRYIQLLEKNILEQPYSWLWTHKRWKR